MLFFNTNCCLGYLLFATNFVVNVGKIISWNYDALWDDIIYLCCPGWDFILQHDLYNHYYLSGPCSIRVVFFFFGQFHTFLPFYSSCLSLLVTGDHHTSNFCFCHFEVDIKYLYLMLFCSFWALRYYAYDHRISSAVQLQVLDSLVTYSRSSHRYFIEAVFQQKVCRIVHYWIIRLMRWSFEWEIAVCFYRVLEHCHKDPEEPSREFLVVHSLGKYKI